VFGGTGVICANFGAGVCPAADIMGRNRAARTSPHVELLMVVRHIIMPRDDSTTASA
jgi:hypothetical protein